MKIEKTASGKQQIKISRSEWESIGKKANWMKKSDSEPLQSEMDAPEYVYSCPVCDAEYENEAKVLNHILRVHKSAPGEIKKRKFK